MKPNRNEPCWCGSGKKYKKCHLKSDLEQGHSGQQNTTPKLEKIERSEEYITGMVKACRLAKKTLDMVEERIKPGITTNDIDKWVYEYTMDHGAYPAPLNYHGFPKSVCTSLNEVVCHGIPEDRIIKEGDLVNVDVTSRLNGYHGDTNRTFLMEGYSKDARKISDVAEECLRLGIEAAKPYNRIGDIGAAIEKYAHSQNCSVVEMFVGHGLGKEFHEDPQVPHYGKPGTGKLIVPGMFFTIEPMINLGRKEVKILSDEWTAVTKDGSLTAQFEHTLMITDYGVRVLTAEDDSVPILG